MSYVLFWEWDVTSTNPESVACFSQWFDRSFIDPDHEGTIYKTAEHYMMAAKARMFDPEAEAAIIASSTPEEAKQMGRAVRNFDRAKWNETADDVVQRASYLRFTQHADLRAYLLATGDKTMVEASPSDRIWGIGFSVRDAPGREGEWGQNRMGLALTRAKIQIKEEEARRY